MHHTNSSVFFSALMQQTVVCTALILHQTMTKKSAHPASETSANFTCSNFSAYAKNMSGVWQQVNTEMRSEIGWYEGWCRCWQRRTDFITFHVRYSLIMLSHSLSDYRVLKPERSFRYFFHKNLKTCCEAVWAHRGGPATIKHSGWTPWHTQLSRMEAVVVQLMVWSD